MPQTDHYSFTRGGQPWYSWEWLSDVLVGGLHRAAGLPGVALFYSTVIAAGVWLWFRLHWAAGGDFLVACGMAPLLLSTESIHWLARPHVISWLFFLASLLYCERRRVFGWRDAAGVFAFSAFWANMHPSFVFAPAIAMIYLLRRDRPRGLGYAVLIALVAPLANPYGYRLYVHVWRYLTDADLLAHVGEYQSFNFHAAGSAQILAALILGMIGGTLSLVQKRPDRFLSSVLFTALALRSARVLPIDALLLLPLANGAITSWLKGSEPRLGGYFGYSGRLRALDARYFGLVPCVLAIVACFALLQTPGLRSATGFAPDQFPVTAYSHIPEGARLFASDQFGGYLIYRSDGRFPVFFDGRSDLYGAEFLRQYGRLLVLKPGWQAWFDSFHFTHVLLPADSSLLAPLEQIGWQPVFRDGTATLLARSGT